MKFSTRRSTTPSFLLLVLVLSGSACGEESHQPYSSYWFVDELLQWTPETDLHAPFNISRTPLAKRFVHAPTQRNPELSTKPKIMTLVSAHPTSNHPSQGFRNNTQYAFPFWQYIDLFVMWGGASNEGLIVTPSVPWIDAAHRNGVEIYGTVFFPPKQYGGKEKWVRELLVQDSRGNFPVADKLLEVAHLYGFDGWFLNQETQGMTPSDAQMMQQFLQYYQRQAAGRAKLIWYDSMIDNGRVFWQEQLNDRNAMFFQNGKQKISDWMFLDFGWNQKKLLNTSTAAKSLKRSPWELFAGIDVQSRSYRTPVDWAAIYKDSKPAHTSVALYWPSSTSDIAKDKSPEAVYAEELKFWNGSRRGEAKQEAAAREAANWKGFSNYFPARSVIQELPFVTRFNYGVGSFYNEEGQRLSDKAWNCLSNQDILPTWQWNVDLKKLKSSFDFLESYHGGSALRIEATLDKGENAHLPLFKTQLSISQTTRARVVAKLPSENALLSLALAFVGTEKQTVNLPLTQLTPGHWTTNECELQPYAGKVLAAVGLTVVAKQSLANETILVGEIAILEGKVKPPSPPTCTVQAFCFDDFAEAYLNIRADSQQTLWYHDIYQLHEGNRKEWLGRASTEQYYLPEVRRPAQHNHVKLAIESTDKHGLKSEPTTVKIQWE